MYNKKCKCPKLFNLRVSAVCDKYNLDYFKAMTSDVFMQTVRGIHNIIPNNSDGLVDSVRLLLENRCGFKQNLLRLLFKAF